MASFGRCRLPNCKRYARLNSDSICKYCNKRISKRLDLSNLIFIRQELGVAPFNIRTRKVLEQGTWQELKLEIEKYYRSGQNNTFIVPASRNNDSGYIYLLKSENGYYKIGKTKDLDKRLKAIVRQFPIKIELVHSFTVTDITKMETALLRAFGHLKLQGDWHRLEDMQVSWLKSISSKQLHKTSDLLKTIPF